MATATELKAWLDTFWPDKLTQEYGLFANRPTTPVIPMVYACTDTEDIYFWVETADTWVQINGSGGGSGDFLADGSVPMTGDINMDGSGVADADLVTINQSAASAGLTINGYAGASSDYVKLNIGPSNGLAYLDALNGLYNTINSTNVTFLSTLQYNVYVPLQLIGEPLRFNDSNTYIEEDVSSNLSFTDAVTGTKTLAELAAGGGGSGTPASTVTDETTFDISAAVGTDTEYARQDHTHGSWAVTLGNSFFS